MWYGERWPARRWIVRRIGQCGWIQGMVLSLVKSLYSTLELGSSNSFAMRIIWNSWVPSKIGFFVREACWGKVLTLDQLQKRGWILANRFFLGKVDEESIGSHTIALQGFEVVALLLVWCLLGSTASHGQRDLFRLTCIIWKKDQKIFG